MRCDISGPKDHIRLDLRVDVISHRSHNINWNIASHSTHWSSLNRWILREAINLSATHHLLTFCACTLNILKVHVDVSELDHFQNRPIIGVLSYFLIDFIKVIIVLNGRRFIRQNCLLVLNWIQSYVRILSAL